MALMGTGNGGGGEDFMPYVKYDGKAGRIFRADKTDDGTNNVDITRTFKAVFDFENVSIGYIQYTTGAAPDFKLVPFGSPMPERPVGKYKPGIRMHVKLAKECGGDVREISSSASVFLAGINAVHDEYLKAAPANPGKLPVIVLHDTIPVTTKVKGQVATNYQPVFTIAGWAPRPADMTATAKAATPPAQSKPSPAKTVEDDAIPFKVPAAATVGAGADDFG